MQLNMTTDYGMRTMFCLFQRAGTGTLRAEDIAQEMKIPLGLMPRIIKVLKDAAYVSTTPGPGGGYRLLPAAYRATVYDVVRLYEPEKIHRCLEDPHECSRDAYGECAFSKLCELVQERLDVQLKSVRVAQLAQVENQEELDQLLRQPI